MIVRGAECLGRAALLGGEGADVAGLEAGVGVGVPRGGRRGEEEQEGGQGANGHAAQPHEDAASRTQPTVSPSDYSLMTR